MKSNRVRRSWTLIVSAFTASAMVAAGAIVFTPAAHATEFSAAGYTIGDGILDSDAPTHPVDTLTDPYGSISEMGPINGSSTKLGVIHAAPLPMLGKTNPNGQVDLKAAYVGSHRDSGTDHVWLYLAWTRDANSGSGVLMYEFNKTAVPSSCDYSNLDVSTCNPWAGRSAGDFIIVWDQSGSSTKLYKRTFSTDSAGALVLGATVEIGSHAAFLPDRFSGEALVDATADIFGATTECTSYANVIPGTVTGNSDTADYKDTVFATIDPIGNCGTLKVKKVVVGGSKGSADFSYTVKTGEDVEHLDDVLVESTSFLASSAFATISDVPPVAYGVAEDAPSFFGYTTDYSTGCKGVMAIGAVKECTVTNTFNKADTDGETQQSWIFKDKVTVTGIEPGAPDASSASVTFTLYSDADCTTQVGTETDSTVVDGVAETSTGVTVTADGTYYWRAAYSGDAYNNGYTTDCGEETTTLTAVE